MTVRIEIQLEGRDRHRKANFSRPEDALTFLMGVLVERCTVHDRVYAGADRNRYDDASDGKLKGSGVVFQKINALPHREWQKVGTCVSCHAIP